MLILPPKLQLRFSSSFLARPLHPDLCFNELVRSRGTRGSACHKAGKFFLKQVC